jgi:hypothetical protein
LREPPAAFVAKNGIYCYVKLSHRVVS